MKQPNKLTIMDEEGNEHVIPSRFEVCGQCRGHGSHDHPAFSNGITSSEWSEMDEDSRENYMSGAYDVTCTCCGGERVVLVPDTDNMSEEQIKMLEEHDRAEREMRAELRAERRAFGYC